MHGAAVAIRNTDFRVLTNADGRFVLRGIPRGEHVWVIEALGYATWEQPINVEHLDQLRIGIMPRPVALEAIRVTVDRLENRRKLAPYQVHTVHQASLRSAAAITAVDLVRSRVPWPTASCPPGVGGPGLPAGGPGAVPNGSGLSNPGQGSPWGVLELCIRYRGTITQPAVCLDDKPISLAMLAAYFPEEVYAIDYIGGPRPQVRLYTERFLESGKPIRPFALGCT